MTSILLQPKSIPTPVDLAVKLKPELKTRAVSGAIFLQQMHYWISKGCGKLFEGVRYIYNTYEQWLKELPWLTEWDFRTVVFKLRELDLIKFEQFGDYGRDRTGYYTINYDHDWLRSDSSSAKKSSDENEFSTPAPSEDTVPTPSEDYPRHTKITPQTFSENTTDTPVVVFPATAQEKEPTPHPAAPLPDLSSSLGDAPQIIGRDTSSAPSDENDSSSQENLLNEVEAAIAAQEMNPVLQRVVAQASVEVVRDALAVLLEAKKKGGVTRPAGFLNRAIQGKWKPEAATVATPVLFPVDREPINPPTPEQMQAMDVARDQGIIRAFYEQPWEGGRAVVVDTGRCVVPWWQILNVEVPQTQSETESPRLETVLSPEQIRPSVSSSVTRTNARLTPLSTTKLLGAVTACEDDYLGKLRDASAP